jgi:hypothetical protein
MAVMFIKYLIYAMIALSLIPAILIFIEDIIKYKDDD